MKIQIRWNGRVYKGDTWDEVLNEILADPMVDSWESMKSRFTEIYGINTDDPKTFQQIAHELAELKIIEILCE